MRGVLYGALGGLSASMVLAGASLYLYVIRGGDWAVIHGLFRDDDWWLLNAWTGLAAMVLGAIIGSHLTAALGQMNRDESQEPG